MGWRACCPGNLLVMSIAWVIHIGRWRVRALIALASGASRAVWPQGYRGDLLCSAGEYWTTGSPAIEV
jgi:hypothetical protein